MAPSKQSSEIPLCGMKEGLRHLKSIFRGDTCGKMTAFSKLICAGSLGMLGREALLIVNVEQY